MRLGDRETPSPPGGTRVTLSVTSLELPPSVGRLTQLTLFSVGSVCATPWTGPRLSWRFVPAQMSLPPLLHPMSRADLSFQNSTFTWFLLLSILQGLPHQRGSPSFSFLCQMTVQPTYTTRALTLAKTQHLAPIAPVFLGMRGRRTQTAAQGCWE